MFHYFHCFALLSQNFASYFVSLIPKVKFMSHVGDFRPIFMVRSLYKLVGKVLAAILLKTENKLISHNQSFFFKGRLFEESVVAMNELIDLTEKTRKTYLIFKVDFEKAYNQSFGDFWIICLLYSNSMINGDLAYVIMCLLVILWCW